MVKRTHSSSMKVPGADGTPSDSNISRTLVLVSSAVRLRISSGLQEKGHHLSVAVTHIVSNLPPEGLRMSGLAERAGLSLQRAGQLVAQLEEDGYVKRVPDSEDGRARRVVYTRRGQRLLRDIDAMLIETSQLLAEIVGESRYEKLVQDLAKLDRALNSDTEGFRIVAS